MGWIFGMWEELAWVCVCLLLWTVFAATVFTGFDYGYVRCATDNPLSCGNIYSVAGGFRTQGGHLTSSLTVGWLLKKVSAAFRRRPTLRLDMAWGF
jgi:hemolysin activation/secretion protein